MVDFWTKKKRFFLNDRVRFEKTLLATYKHPQAGPFPPHGMWETLTVNRFLNRRKTFCFFLGGVLKVSPS